MKPLDIIIHILSAAVWRLESHRARWQTERDHRDANQLGRRNLQPQQIAVLRGNIYNRRKAKHGGDRKSEGAKSKGQNELLISTSEQVAAETGVSPATIKRDGKP